MDDKRSRPASHDAVDDLALGAVATAVLDRLAALAETLDPEERLILAALLTPALALADDEVSGFGTRDWLPGLPVAVADAVSEHGLSGIIEP